MSATVVLLHGRSQEFKDVAALTQSWLDGLDIGLRAAGHPQVRRDDVVMPFYGNELYHATAASAAAPIRLESTVDRPGPFHPHLPAEVGEVERMLLADTAREARVPVVQQEGIDAVLSWGLARRVLDSLARRTRVDQAIITEHLRDVAVYLTVGRDAVLSRVRRDLPAEGDLVVVSHSLGTVVARDLLLDDGLRTRTVLWVTAGSPLGIDAVRRNLLPGGQTNPAVPWVSTYDVNDIVALGHPFGPKWGSPKVIDIEVENDAEPHSIVRYLAHADVAAHIGRALATSAGAPGP